MYQDEATKAFLEKEKAIKMLTKAKESEEIKEIVTKLYYKPAQSLKERYKYVKKSREEGNFEIFKKIADFLAETFIYYAKVDDEDDGCLFPGNDAYDFELILSLSRFYQNNKSLFDGHFHIIKRMCQELYNRHQWEKVKEFWLKHTLNL